MARSSNLPEPTASAAPVRALGARRLLLALAVVLALYAVDLACATTVPASAHAFAVNVAVPFDLMVCVPAAFYLLVVRRRGLTPLAVLPVVWAGYLAASQLVAPGLLSPLAVSAAAGSAGTFSLLPPLFAAALALDAAVIACEARRLVRAFRAASCAPSAPHEAPPRARTTGSPRRSRSSRRVGARRIWQASKVPPGTTPCSRGAPAPTRPSADTRSATIGKAASWRSWA